jgi:hypothetical protein
MSTSGPVNFYHAVSKAEDYLTRMRQFWFENNWTRMGQEASALAKVAAQIAEDAYEVAEREQRYVRGPAHEGHVAPGDGEAPGRET